MGNVYVSSSFFTLFGIAGTRGTLTVPVMRVAESSSLKWFNDKNDPAFIEFKNKNKKPIINKLLKLLFSQT